MSKKPPELKNIEILGNTWTARHLARHLLATAPHKYKLRLWNDTASAVLTSGIDTMPKMMLVPSFLKEHKGLGFRTMVESPMIHHHRRKRDEWTHPIQTAKNLNCCPEVLAVLHDLVFFNSYGAHVLSGQLLKSVNFDWHKAYEPAHFSKYTPTSTVLAAKPSVERVWDSVLTHDGATLNYAELARVESVREHPAGAGLALILSAPDGLQDETDHVVRTSFTLVPSWQWESYQCVVSRELVSSIPRFFVWIDPDQGEDFLSTGLLYDGGILRVITVPVPQSEDKILVQVDRLTQVSLRHPVDPSAFFVGSPWYALESQAWTKVPAANPDDMIYGARQGIQGLAKKIARQPVTSLGISSSGTDHYAIR